MKLSPIELQSVPLYVEVREHLEKYIVSLNYRLHLSARTI